LVVVAVTGAAVGVSSVQTPVYQASIKILMEQEQLGTAPGSLGGDVQGLQQLTQTMPEGIKSRPIAEAVIQQLDLQMTTGDLLENLSAKQISPTQFIRVDYRDSSPQRAQQVANAVGDAFSEQISDVGPSTGTITANVWERAEVPTVPVSPNFGLNIGLALVIGLILGVALAFLLEYLDDSWRSPEEVEQISGVPALSIVPAFDTSKSNKESTK